MVHCVSIIDSPPDRCTPTDKARDALANATHCGSVHGDVAPARLLTKFDAKTSLVARIEEVLALKHCSFPARDVRETGRSLLTLFTLAVKSACLVINGTRRGIVAVHTGYLVNLRRQRAHKARRLRLGSPTHWLSRGVCCTDGFPKCQRGLEILLLDGRTGTRIPLQRRR